MPNTLVRPSSSCCSGERDRFVALTMSAMRPICVAWPVAVTTKVAEPRVTWVFWNTMSVRSPSAVSSPGTVERPWRTGALSPVRAASCTSSVADDTIRPSAGTRSPASTCTTSPGTRFVDSISSRRPDRRTRACGTWSCASASTLARAFSSWFEPITTLNVTRPSDEQPGRHLPDHEAGHGDDQQHDVHRVRQLAPRDVPHARGRLRRQLVRAVLRRSAARPRRRRGPAPDRPSAATPRRPRTGCARRRVLDGCSVTRDVGLLPSRRFVRRYVAPRRDHLCPRRRPRRSPRSAPDPDRGPPAGSLDEPDGGLDLRTHGSGGERARASSSAVTRRRSRCSGVPQSSYTPSTSVTMTNTSAPTSRASSSLARSLSMTASTPDRASARRPAAYIVGMPPPPAQITTTPLSRSHRIGRISKIRFGCGDGTTRRQRSPSCLNDPALLGGEASASSLS